MSTMVLEWQTYKFLPTFFLLIHIRNLLLYLSGNIMQFFLSFMASRYYNEQSPFSHRLVLKLVFFTNLNLGSHLITIYMDN